MDRIPWRNTFFLSLILTLIAGPAMGAGPPRVAVLPFRVVGENEGTSGELGRSVQEMLISRVGAGGGLEVVDSGEVMGVLGKGAVVRGRSSAVEAGRRVGVGYVVFGSVTVLGGGVSVDGEVVDVGSGRVLGHVYGQSADLGGVVPEVGKMAQRVRSLVLGGGQEVSGGAVVRGSSLGVKEPPGGYPVPPGGFTGGGGRDLFVRSDEPLLQRGAGGEALNPAFIMSYEMDRARRGYVKSGELDLGGVQGIGVGDVDGDGEEEIVVADEDVVVVFNRALVDVSDRVVIRPRAAKGKIVGLDVADVDGDGLAEVYVSVIRVQGEEVSSEVWVYDRGSGRYRPILVGLPYLMRVVRTVEGRLEVLGQRKRPQMMTDKIGQSLYSPFKRPWVLRWEGGRLREVERLPLEGVCVLGIGVLDVDKDAVAEYVGFDGLGYMKLFNHRGKAIWVSDGKYGRTANFYYRDFGRQFGPSEEMPADRVYLPPRVDVVDLDGDGFEEVVFGYNHEPMALLAQTRVFNKSVVFSMSWDGTDFVENWRTREMRGYIGDCVVRDVDGDQRPELLLGFVRRTGAADYLRTKVTLLAFDLKIQKAKKKAPKKGPQGER